MSEYLPFPGDLANRPIGSTILIKEAGRVYEKLVTPASTTQKPWTESPYPTKGAGGGKLPVDDNFVRGLIISREKLTSSGITVGEEIAQNCDSLLHLQEGQILADLGCGPGLISCHLVQKVGPTGHTYCLDASEKMLHKAGAVMFGKNTTLIHGDIHVADRLIPEKVDAVILSGNVHLITNREMAFKAIKRILKPEGKLVIVCHAYYHKNVSNSNLFADRIDTLRESRKDLKIDGLRLPMLSEKELNSVIEIVKKAGLNVNAYEKDTFSPDSNMVFGFPPERTILHRLAVTHPQFTENEAAPVASLIMTEVNKGRQAQVYLLCTNQNRFVSTPSSHFN